MKTKELLSSWGVAFDAVDTEVQPEAMQELERFGIKRVPAVIAGERAVHGWNPKGVADLVGVMYDEGVQLTASELAERLDVLLDIAQGALRQIPADQLSTKTPGRNRSLQHLGYHIFRVAQSYRDTRELGYLSEAWFEEKPAAGDDSEAIARYGERVRQHLQEWWQRHDAHHGEVNTYYGPQDAMAFLERTVWHVAQHVRHLYAMLDILGITPARPLTEAHLRGLPLPQTLW